MLNISPEAHNPQIKHILKFYKKSAANSLQCTAASSASNKESLQSNKPKTIHHSNRTLNSIKRPISCVPNIKNKFSLNNAAPNENLLETLIEGQRVASFLVAGEPRLCVPHFLSNIFCGDYTELELVIACEKLQIQLHPASSKQLIILKSRGYLLDDVDKCSLITRSDGERLCGAMLHRPYQQMPINAVDGLKICHDCFGGCEGTLNPNLYRKAISACIQCRECCTMLTPMQFVCHSHRCDLETRTLHWGFESTQWRVYIFLSTDHWYSDDCQTMLDDVKMKFTVEEEQRLMMDEEYEPSEKCLRENTTKPINTAVDTKQWKDWQKANIEKASQLALNILQQTINESKRCLMKIPEYLYLDSPVLLDMDSVIESMKTNEGRLHYVPNITLYQEPYHQLRYSYEDKNIAANEKTEDLCKFNCNYDANDDDDDDDDDCENWSKNEDTNFNDNLIVASEEVVSSSYLLGSYAAETMFGLLSEAMRQSQMNDEEKQQMIDAILRLQRQAQEKMRFLEMDNYELRQKVKDLSSRLGKMAAQQFELAMMRGVIKIEQYSPLEENKNILGNIQRN